MFQVSSFKKNGFTLLEMLVGITIFSIIIGIVLGIFVSAIRIQRYYLASQQLLNQTSYAMEYMNRFIRMAKKDLDGNCIGLKENYESISGDYLMFEDYKSPPNGPNCLLFYFVNNGRLYYEVSGETFVLNSDDIEITDFKVYLSGESQEDDYLQPKVTIFLGARGKGESPQPSIKLQTTISQRDLDVKE